MHAKAQIAKQVNLYRCFWQFSSSWWSRWFIRFSLWNEKNINMPLLCCKTKTIYLPMNLFYHQWIIVWLNICLANFRGKNRILLYRFPERFFEFFSFTLWKQIVYGKRMNEYLRGQTKFLSTFSILILVNKQLVLWFSYLLHSLDSLYEIIVWQQYII